MLVGEKMPDKNDPKYKERYEREVAAGRKFAKATRIDRIAARVQCFADRHKELFLIIVFGFAGICLALNIYRMARVYSHCHSARTATEIQDSVLRTKYNRRNITDERTTIISGNNNNIREKTR